MKIVFEYSYFKTKEKFFQSYGFNINIYTLTEPILYLSYIIVIDICCHATPDKIILNKIIVLNNSLQYLLAISSTSPVNL